MMNPELIIVLYLIGAYWLFSSTWLHYLAIMNLKRNKRKLTTRAKILAAPHVIVGYLLDVLLNLIVGTVLFRELPREWVLTDRLKRHISFSQGWRLRRAAHICDNYLDPFDPDGTHCGTRKL